MCWVGVLVQGRYGDTFGGIRGGHWGGRVGFGGSCTACAGGGGGVCVRGGWFPPVKSLADKFLVFTLCLSGFWLVGIGFKCALSLFSVSGEWCGCSVVGLGSLGVTLGVFLVHCVLCCAGDSKLCMLGGTDGWMTPRLATFSCPCYC